jgi:membrane protease YdiL (CAAX protease family)
VGKQIVSRYLIGTFILTYVMWGVIIIAKQFNYLKSGTPLSMILFIIGGNAPAIVAYTILKKERAIYGFGQYVKEAFAIKQKPLNYLIVMIFLSLYFGVPYLMKGITKQGDFYLGLLNIPVMILLGGLEELGWRYILQPELEKRFTFGVASALTSLIWAIWHLPLFYIAGTSQSGSSFGLYTIMVFGMSFALAAIYHVSKSIWLCILFHTMINAFSSTWIINESIKTRICTSTILILLSFALVTYYKMTQEKSLH